MTVPPQEMREVREARESLGGVHTCVAYVDLTGLVPGSLRYQNNANLAISEKKRLERRHTKQHPPWISPPRLLFRLIVQGELTAS